MAYIQIHPIDKNTGQEVDELVLQRSSGNIETWKIQNNCIEFELEDKDLIISMINYDNTYQRGLLLSVALELNPNIIFMIEPIDSLPIHIYLGYSNKNQKIDIETVRKICLEWISNFNNPRVIIQNN